MMNLAENYRSSLDYREILRILQKSTTLQENFLWQSHAMGKTVIPIHHFEIDFVTREVVVFYDSMRFKLDPELPLYVKLDYRTTVFKTADYFEKPNSVSFSFPREIKTLELRGARRFQIKDKIEERVSLRPSLIGTKDFGNELEVRVHDISETGLGLIVSEHNRSFLKNNRILWVTAIGGHKLHDPLLAEVVYMNNEFDSKLKGRKQKELKVGLKLSGMISADIFSNFLK